MLTSTFVTLLILLGTQELFCSKVTTRTNNWRNFRDDYLSASQTCYTLGFTKERRENSLKAKEIIAFDASFSSSMTKIKSGQRLVFALVDENINHGYNARTGVFTAPGSGVFVFQWSTVVTGTHYIQTVIVVNGKKRALNECNTTRANNDSCTRMAVVRLAVGDKVWIECVKDNSAINDYKSSAFTGFRL
ncbi:complement C1q tumor necrosis factor-related protein 3-like isoform X2 [Ostrea edulis]|nr:complement C1q tumor necrosis factor-related protein 3-like isoform X2 [Ostrea edulis]